MSRGLNSCGLIDTLLTPSRRRSLTLPDTL